MFIPFCIKMADKELSEFKIERIECPRCGATWLNGQHYWSTGVTGDPETLSNLVCGMVEDSRCINPSHKKGHIYGEKDTWEKRSKFINNWTEERNA